MKLSRRYSRVNLITSFIILLITGIAYYLVIHFILTEQLDKDLAIEEEEIVAYTKLYKSLPAEANFKDQIVRYHFEPSAFTRRFSDTVYNNLKGNEEEPGRRLTTSVTLTDKLVKVEIIKSKVESEDLVRIIFFITLGIIVLLLLSLALINRFILNRLWKPFHVTLSQLRVFNISDDREIHQEDTSIDEFVELNTAVTALTMRIRKDYVDLKSFTDTASHEMMTPLAVIHSKLDILLQTGTFTQNQGELLEDIFNGMSRLSRLNQSLLLLAKIENHLIQDKHTISLKKLVMQKSRQFQEILEAEEISATLNLDEKEVCMSKYLADILLNNLFSNAIRHNIKKGVVNIVLNSQFLSISNTGSTEPLNDDKIFHKFNKDNSSEGMGLGLAISKEICHYYAYRLTYQYHSGQHSFTIFF